MSGHSKWATIKRKKAVQDAARGRVFTKLIKEIAIAARDGGGDPNGNPRLRLAIQSAKANNMPADNIKRAIQRGTGELPGVTYEEITYEAYGPGGIALLISCVTDNKNRLVAELRHMLERNGGKLAEAGSVSWAFQKKGVLTVPRQYEEDTVLVTILDAGAEDMKTEDDAYEITTPPENFDAVRRGLEEKGIKVEQAETQMVPQNTLRVEGKDAEHVLKLMEVLEEHDDVQHVYSNFDIDDKVMASFQAG